MGPRIETSATTCYNRCRMAVVARIGTEFAGYRVEALLGRGGMSVVYRAENARLGNKVALKLIAEELAHDESFRERFVRESRTAAALNHPNVVPIYDAGDEDGVLFIAMRYVESDLKQLLAREGPLSVEKTLSVIGQIGSALDAAHARGLLHRDVKPANILLDAASEPGGAPHSYLADFGLTKHLESRSGITASGQFVGTIDYMSPEQIEGRDVDGRTDIYSLGCVLFECLGGATPFRRETDVAVLWAHMREEPPPVTELQPELPGAVDLVLARAVAKDPAHRYPTARELVEELKAALEGAPSAATRIAAPPAISREPTPAEDSESETRPRSRRALAASAAFGALVLGGVLGIVGYETLREVEPRIVEVKVSDVPLDRELLALIPEPIQPHCKAKERLTLDFKSSIVCTPPGRAVRRVEYNDAESAARMSDYFVRRIWAEGILFPGEDIQPREHCGSPPALQEWRRTTGGGHEPLEAGEEAKGRMICYRRNGWAAIEWTDQDVDVYSLAYGPDLIRLFRWWKGNAGPLPAD
jgi:serine/threonine protein kinase